MADRDEATATVGFVRPVRRPPPGFPTADIELAAPPQRPRPVRGRWLGLVPVLTAVLMLAVMAMLYRSGAAAGTGNPVYLVFPLVMLVSMVAGVAAGRHRRPDADLDAERDDYFAYLAGLRTTVADAAAAQRLSLDYHHPEPDALWTLVAGPRMWERRRDDADFGWVRVGVGAVRLARRLVEPSADPVARTDPVTGAALRRFVETHSTLPGAPTTLRLADAALVTVDGDRECARALLRAVICQLAVLHGPDLLTVTAVLDAAGRDHWDWLKWLPHHRYPSASAEPEAAHRVLIVDGGTIDPDRVGTPGVTVVEISPGGPGPPDGLRLRLSGDTLTVRRSGGDQPLGRPDRVELLEAIVCARRLAGYRLTGATAGGSAGRAWPELLDDFGGLGGADPEPTWHRLKRAERLRVPIGTADDGAVVWVDIKEPAEGGIGPHGLCVGATGSGKSELLRTIALGMIARHSPETLNLVLVDFKGGATFLDLERAEHVAAVITNLADEAPLVARMRDALAGELNRRQELLRSAGGFVSVAAYQAARLAGAALPPLPALLVIVDEFSELLSRHPDFADMFGAIGRLGRSLGVHLLLASQRLDEGRLRGLESHLSYRICLKTLSANESRIVLGVPDAHRLPGTPGLGYLQAGSDGLTRFRAAYVSGPGPADPAPGASPPAPPVRLFTAAETRVTVQPTTRSAPRRTVLQTVLDRVAGHGPPAHRVWLPPLGASPTLARLLADRAGGPELVVPIGVVDRPYQQRCTPLLADLRGPAGNVAVVGAPQSGKSTALAALITALAGSHDPARVQVYGLDFGGGVLAALRPLPQLGSVAGRAEPDLVRRTVAELRAVVARRESLFRERGIASVQRFRRLRADADPDCAADRYGDVFLVIDGWAGLCRDFAALEEPVVDLAGRGLSFGVHVVLSASRWAEIRPALRDQVGTRIELRLGDAADSELDRRAAEQVPRDRPGRCLTVGGLHALIAWPSLLDPGTSTDPAPGVAEAARQAGALLAERHGELVAPAIPVLPELVHRADLITAAPDRPVLGIDEGGLDVVTMDFGRQPHLLIIGDTECGKTATLRTLCAELVRTATAGQVQLTVIDYRRGLLDTVDADHLAGYAASPAALAEPLTRLVDRLARRMPGAEVTAEQLRRRSWWSGPRQYLVVDDYDLVAGPSGSPLAPVLEYLPYAVDLGLHLLVARRSGGAARAAYEPLLAALRELGCMGLLMSGDPDEAPLIGSARPVWLPPGRGTLVTRAGGEQRIQVAWSPPS